MTSSSARLRALSASTSLTARLLLGGVLLVSGCATTGGGDEPGGRDDPSLELVGGPVDLVTRPDLLAIKSLEVARSTGGGELQAALSDPDPTVRIHAARALGRLPYPRYGDVVTAPLCQALDDPDPDVRAEAAFALGIRGDLGGRALLTASTNDPEATVRAKVVEALTRLGSEDSIDTVLRALDDPSPAVRQEAIVGLARWTREEPRADEIDSRLVSMLLPRRNEELASSERWLVLYALQRRRAPAGAGAFLDHYRAGASTGDDRRYNVNARLFAVRGLRRLDPSGESSGAAPRPELTRALERALDDVDWRIVVEAALGLGEHGDPESISALIQQLEHDSPHVRRAVIQALGNFQGFSRSVSNALARGLSDTSTSVRAETLVSIAKVLPANDSLVTLEQMRADGDEVIRAGVARAAGTRQLPTASALALLEPLLDDTRTFVSMQAIDSLGQLADPAADTLLRRVITNEEDLVLVQAAATAIGTRAVPEDLDLLAARLEVATGTSVDELWGTALELATTAGGDGAFELARRGEDLANPYLSARASEVLMELGAVSSEGLTGRAESPPAAIPIPGRDYPLWRTNPIIAIDTNRGSMYFELYADVAPMHVFNLLALAESGYYDSTRFHRVELDFVIQGGDVRGDGAGGTSWRGDSLGAEFSTRKYLRGSLGMPRWSDPDSGGAQIFVTHRPTPHLDGRYTLFGQLVAGWEVLDSVEVGDRIRGVRVYE
ncbi:MAG: HEAT repeat domain-containing protein [Planctomycetota bacterium]|jgi:cyclophilin family peptidyl-prolyl cis-trans isomerase/HEAT repeat protein